MNLSRRRSAFSLHRADGSQPLADLLGQILFEDFTFGALRDYRLDNSELKPRFAEGRVIRRQPQFLVGDLDQSPEPAAM